MSDPQQAWNGEAVRIWLQSRIEASRLDQAAADRKGYGAQDDYDKAAAEEWVCRALLMGDTASDQTRFAARIKVLLGQDEYRTTGIYDDRRFEREVKATLRKVAKMTKANDGFEKLTRYQ